MCGSGGGVGRVGVVKGGLVVSELSSPFVCIPSSPAIFIYIFGGCTRVCKM